MTRIGNSIGLIWWQPYGDLIKPSAPHGAWPSPKAPNCPTVPAYGGMLRGSPKFVEMTKHKDRIPGTVRWFDGEEGCGVIDSPEVPGGCFVLFSNIVGVGYRNLDDGQDVVFTFEELGFKQDGY